jgi:hypothetical protein
VRGGNQWRGFRFVVAAALLVGAFGVLAPDAHGATPKACKSLDALNKELQKVDPSGSTVSSQQFSDIASAFRRAARKAPKQLKAAMTTIAGVYQDLAAADDRGDALARFASHAKEYSKAITTWTTYYPKNCSNLS